MKPELESSRSRGRMGVWSLLTGLALSITGCASDEDGAAEGVTVTDSAGVAIVVNSASEWGDTPAWSISAEPSLRIGVADGDPEYQLFNVVGVEQGSDGSIYIANGGSTDIRIFDAQGTHLRTMGVDGEGPGEFRSLNWMALIPGDTIAAWDVQQRRISHFTSAGDFVRSWNIEHFYQFERILPGGDYIVWGGNIISNPLADGEFRGTNPWNRMTLTDSSAVIDTLTVVESSGGWILTFEGGISFYNLPFDTYPVVEFANDRFAVGARSEYRIDVYGIDGSRRRSIRRSDPNRPVTSEDMSGWVEDRLEDVAEDRQAEMRRIYEEMPVAETFPAHGEMHYDALGYLWVEGVPDVPEFEDRWSVFDPEGRWLGDLTLPAGMEVHEIGADYILGVVEDEFEVEYVVRYALTR